MSVRKWALIWIMIWILSYLPYEEQNFHGGPYCTYIYTGDRTDADLFFGPSWLSHFCLDQYQIYGVRLGARRYEYGVYGGGAHESTSTQLDAYVFDDAYLMKNDSGLFFSRFSYINPTPGCN